MTYEVVRYLSVGAHKHIHVHVLLPAATAWWHAVKALGYNAISERSKALEVCAKKNIGVSTARKNREKWEKTSDIDGGSQISITNARNDEAENR